MIPQLFQIVIILKCIDIIMYNILANQEESA